MTTSRRAAAGDLDLLSGPAASPDNAAMVARVDAALSAFLAGRRPDIEAAGPDLVAVADAAADLVFAGGKRLRPLFTYWGWRCIEPAGERYEDALISAAAGLELLHVSALIHDDLIDDSATRRGQPAAHARFARLLRDEDPGAVDAGDFGGAAAILLGDLLLSWAGSMVAAAALPESAARAARADFDAMAAEMMAGQYLDILEQARGRFALDAALRVARFKSSKYTVERPLLMGAAAAGAPSAVRASLTAFGLPIGEAFQLRDDLLGVFGDPVRTGKPAGDDLREGKRTVLVALAHRATDDSGRVALTERLGDPELDGAGVTALRTVIEASGAVDELEAMIDERWRRALAALEQAPIRDDARDALTSLATAAVVRET